MDTAPSKYGRAKHPISVLSRVGSEYASAIQLWCQTVRSIEDSSQSLLLKLRAASYLFHFMLTCVHSDDSSHTLRYALQDARQWGIEIARGMQYLAEKNILHRDLKTPNILLTTADAPGSVSRARRGQWRPLPPHLLRFVLFL